MRFFWRVSVAASIVLALIFGAYVYSLYRQLEHAFGEQEQFTPTRIYSDVTRIAAPRPRAIIETNLQSRGYAVTREAELLRFKLHPIEYPAYLVPMNHPVLAAAGADVVLKFQGPGPRAPLQSIEIGGKESPEVFLEPELVATLSRYNSHEIREPLRFDQIPSAVWKAIIAVEDQNFLEHKGLDPRGIARAIWVNLRTASLAQGGSTITQQLVKNLLSRRTKNIFRKSNELFLALLLEARYSKQQILERYLNEVYLGQVGSLEVHGVAEGAQHFFGKKVTELNVAEIAMMAGLIRGPGFYSPYRYWNRAIERQRIVLKKMVETGQIARAEADEALKLPIRLAPPVASANRAPYFTDFVKAELIRLLRERMSESEIISAGLRVYTTLDLDLNSSAQRAVTQGIMVLEKRMRPSPAERLEGALAAVDQNTGFIRALIGGRGYAQSNFNRILNMKRQVGSTFKPIVYLSAFLKGRDASGVPYGPAHPIEDAPWKLVYDHGRQVWAPKNYEKQFLGWTDFRTALSHSINTAAARLGIEVGLSQVIDTAKKLGIESSLPEVPSLSLGVAELSPVELLRAYATLGANGVATDFMVIRGISFNDGSSRQFANNSKNVFDPAPVELVNDMLRSVFTDGTAREAAKMGFSRWAAGKTGTTSDHRDAWFAGFSPELTAVVWVGLDQASEPAKGAKKSKIQLTGAGAALPVWTAFMRDALDGMPEAAWVPPHLSGFKFDRRTGRPAAGNCPPAQVVEDKLPVGVDAGASSCEPGFPASKGETTLD